MKLPFVSLPVPLKYAFVGALGTVIDVGLLYLLVEFGHLHLLLAATLSFVAAVTNGFLWNKYWTFQSLGSDHVARQYTKFTLVALCGLAMNNAILWVLSDEFGLWYVAAKLVASGAVALWNYFSNKIWTFGDFSIARGALPPLPAEQPALSIIIPAYNEERTLAATIGSVTDWCNANEPDYEVLIVDDGSKDKTAELATQMSEAYPRVQLIRLAQNSGKGRAVQTGMLAACGRHVLFMDADNSTEMADWPRLKERLAAGADIAIGSRYLPESNVTMPQSRARILLSRSGNLLIRALLLGRIADTQCGFKAFTWEAAQHIFPKQKIERWAFDMEVLAIGKHMGFRIAEAPVTWANALGRQSNVHAARDAWRTLRDLYCIKMNLWRKRY